jgi:hypothetical protein
VLLDQLRGDGGVVADHRGLASSPSPQERGWNNQVSSP